MLDQVLLDEQGRYIGARFGGRVYTMDELCKLTGCRQRTIKNRLSRFKKNPDEYGPKDVLTPRRSLESAAFESLDMGPRMDVDDIKIGSWERENLL